MDIQVGKIDQVVAYLTFVVEQVATAASREGVQGLLDQLEFGILSQQFQVA